jgi:hypothetical protein
MPYITAFMLDRTPHPDQGEYSPDRTRTGERGGCGFNLKKLLGSFFSLESDAPSITELVPDTAVRQTRNEEMDRVVALIVAAVAAGEIGGARFADDFAAMPGRWSTRRRVPSRATTFRSICIADD